MVETETRMSDFSHLKTYTTTDVRTSWRKVIKDVKANGAVLILNHKNPEAVILSLEAYREMKPVVNRFEQANSNSLEELSRRFDEWLAILNAPEPD